METKFTLQEKIYQYKKISLKEIIWEIPKYEWKKSISWLSFPIHREIRIPIDKNHLFYGVRLVPYFEDSSNNTTINVPTILLNGSMTDSKESFKIDNNQYTYSATYDLNHPGYKTKLFEVTHDYLEFLISSLVIEIEVLEHAGAHPLAQVWTRVEYEEFQSTIIKEGVFNKEFLESWHAYYSLVLEELVFNGNISSYIRTPIFSLAYPVYKSMLLTSFYPVFHNRSSQIPWLSYDEDFYTKSGVPVFRTFGAYLEISGTVKKD